MSSIPRFKIALLFLIAIAPAEFNWLYNPRLASKPALFWTVDCLRFLVIPSLILIYGLRKRLFSTQSLGLHNRIAGHNWPPVFVLTLVLVPCVQYAMDRPFLTWSYDHFPLVSTHQKFSYNQMIPPPGPQTGGRRLLAIFYLAASAGFVEEFYFRGLFRRLFNNTPIQAGLFVLLSSLAFASVHLYGGPPHAIYAFLHGLLAATIYLATGNLWPVIVGHMIVDLSWFMS